MKRVEKVLTYVLILCAGIAVGLMTPQSWYPRGASLRAPMSVRASLQR